MPQALAQQYTTLKNMRVHQPHAPIWRPLRDESDVSRIFKCVWNSAKQQFRFVPIRPHAKKLNFRSSEIPDGFLENLPLPNAVGVEAGQYGFLGLRDGQRRHESLKQCGPIK